MRDEPAVYLEGTPTFDMSFAASKDLIIEFGRVLAKSTMTEALQALTLMTVFLIDKSCDDDALKAATAQQICGEVKTGLKICRDIGDEN